ncbi:sensor domain-containing phosphodiesterase [Edwardsiella piscicida]|uniref:sensor domain-containing phosphodiesterase n=1 Tax=Edwardsiella piscicida TaxID=1263550 RepID=UPI002913C43A|nr:sensor domain-containing phosphodiesterase [Edwardsiella piscicida]ELM3729982.1 sensor domain-containing phosphodiesterase [Edwardsiella piscicida]ELV7535505.1 sensor domain-containing phosphodiesterase [Edwardsiella piscicida]
MQRVTRCLGQYALPASLSVLLLPLTWFFSPHAVVNGQALFLLPLPMALAAALVMLFGPRALPSLSLALLLFALLLPSLSFAGALALGCALLLPLSPIAHLSQRLLGKRGRCDLNRGGGTRLAIRLLGFGLFYPIGSWLMMLLGGTLMTPLSIGTAAASPRDLPFALLALEGMILSCVALTPALYYLLRMLLNPGSLRAFLLDCRRALRRDIRGLFLPIYVAAMGALCFPPASHVNLGYLTPLLFVLFVFASFHFRYRAVLLLWALTVLGLLACSANFIQLGNRHYQLAFLSSALIAFSIALVYMAQVITRNDRMRRLYLRLRLRLRRRDGLVDLPNFRALNDYLARRPCGTLCILRLSNLDILSRCHGMTMRAATKSQLAAHLAPLLRPGERVYQMPGAELLIYLQADADLPRINAIRATLIAQALVWQQHPVTLQYGVAYSPFDAHRQSIHAVVGQLSYLAERACRDNVILPLYGNEADANAAVNEQVFWLQKITRALQENALLLYAQPIVHREGQRYYEILARLQDGEQLVLPGKFIPFITAFNLCAQFDLLIIENVVRHIHRAGLDSSSTCFSVNLMPLTLMQNGVAAQIIALFERYQVRPQAVIFEITEQQYLLDENAALETVRALRDYCFKIAIDDFGTGLSNYQRLKHLNADVVKIDGMFVKDIVSSSLDRLIIKSICDIARERQLQVVAEYVESREQMEILCSLGVQYLQGFLLGEPRPLAQAL